MRQHGFTQLGRKISGISRREARHDIHLSVVMIAFPGEEFSLSSVAGSFSLLRDNDLSGEVILVDCVSPRERLEQLLRDFPNLKILIPTNPVSRLAAFQLGVSEAVASKVMLLTSSCKPGKIDVKRLLSFFDDIRLFSVGFLQTEHEIAVIPRFEQGRVLLDTDAPEASKPVLYLPGFIGIYDKEKFLKIDLSSRVFSSPWADIDFFYGAWSRGWITMIDAESQYSSSGMDSSILEPHRFFERIRYFRGEICFLRRNLIDSMHRKLRRRFFFRYSFHRILRFDFAPAIACLVERFRGLIVWNKRERREGAVFSASEIFAIIREGV